MERTLSCPYCGYVFRVSKEAYEKYRRGISHKKHDATDGEFVLLDCTSCGRTMKLDIRTWRVVTGTLGADERSEWVGGEKPSLGAADAKRPARADDPFSARRVSLVDLGRVEKPPEESGIGTIAGALFLFVLPVLMAVVEAPLVSMAGDRGYRVEPPPAKEAPPSEKAVPGAAPAAKGPSSDAVPVAKETPLVAPAGGKQPLWTGGKFEKMLKKYNRQMEDMEKGGGAERP